jgi:DNA end-binding protein Ku
MLYDTPYWVVPVAGAAKAYQLMHRAMLESQRVAIGRVVLRQKGHLVALRPHGDLLTMETMIYADEVVSPESLDDAAGAADGKVAAKELQVARQLIEMLSGPFEPERYRDDYRDAVLAMIERKVAGEEIAVAPTPAPAEAAPDLMAALQASIAAVGKHAETIGDGAAAKPKAKRRAAPAASKPRAGSRKS